MPTITVTAVDALGATATATVSATQSGSSPTIPMSWNDSRFAANKPGPVNGPSGATASNLDWSENPNYPTGDPCWYWGGGNLSISRCRVDWREGPRIAATDGATFNVDQCFINCVGMTGDHADSFQAYAGSGVIGHFNITNSCIHAYSDSAAQAKYGGGFVGSTCLFWADYSQGSVSFTNCLLIGGSRMITVNCDRGPTHVSLNNVYFIPDGDTAWEFNSVQDGGTLIIDNWTNVFNATIVNGVIVPGSAIPHP